MPKIEVYEDAFFQLLGKRMNEQELVDQPAEAPVRHDRHDVAGAKIVGESGDDRVDARDEAGPLALRHQLPHHPMGIEPLILRDLARSEDVGDDDDVGWAERPGQSVLEYVAPQRPRPGLEDRADSTVTVATPDRAEGLGDGGGVVGEVIQHGDPVDLAAQLQPSLDAPERLETRHDFLGGQSLPDFGL